MRSGSMRKTFGGASKEIAFARYDSKESTVAPSSAMDPSEEMRMASRQRRASEGGDPNKIRLPLGLGAQMALGVRKLANSMNLPFDETHRAVNIFARFVDCPAGTDVMEIAMYRGKFTDCLSHVMQLKGSSKEISEEITDRAFKLCDTDGSGTIDVTEFCIWYTSESFSKTMMLDEETQGMRRFAEKNNISLLDIDRYKGYFDKFDLDGSGEIDYEEFSALITLLWKIPKNAEIPESRLKTFWKMADLDGSGALEFEEFVLFYRKYCESGGDGDPITDFYKSIRRF
jgi:Ca2+-binding EF-hand superfamily protein